MSEHLTSLEDAEEMREWLICCAMEMDESGFDRGAIGAAMFGFGLSILCDERGPGTALSAIDSVRKAILARMSKSN